MGSRAHRPRLWWTNLLPHEVLKRAFTLIQRPPDLTVNGILDAGRQAQVVKQNDRPPFALVNKVGMPRLTLPTLMSYPASHAYREGGPGLVWDHQQQQLVEPNANEQERAMGFPTGTTALGTLTEEARRQVLGQAMDLNCLTWIVSLGLAEQARMVSTGVLPIPQQNLEPIGTIEAKVGGKG